MHKLNPMQAQFMPSPEQLQARTYFPRGLTQPEGSFRFSIDALLLSSFVKVKKNSRLLDLGTGCGVVGLNILLNTPINYALQVLGLDIDPTLVSSAQANAAKLGFSDNFFAQRGDVAAIRSLLPAETFDLVATNPPYRRINQGRLPEPDLRKNALFEGTGNLNSFIAGAAFALKNGGAFYCIYPADRLVELLSLLRQYCLEPKLILPVQAQEHKDLELVLLRATKNGRAGLKIKKPLLLYEKEGENMRLSSQALAFCPWLECNAASK